FTAGGWTTDGDASVSTTNEFAGIYSASVEDTGYLQIIVDAEDYTNIQLEYARYTYLYDYGEELTVAWSTNGSSRNEVETYDDGWALNQVSLGAGADDQPTLYIRFSSDAWGAYERFRIDNVMVTGEIDNGDPD